MELVIGNLKLKNNVLLAPLAGITDLPFRVICKRFGAGMVCTEMISSHGLVFSDRETEKILSISAEEKPVSAQIFGSNPEIMAKAAKKIQSLGADVLDLNFGCSVRKVLKGKSGSALMKDLKLLKDIACAVVEAVSIPVTAKLRSGADSKNVNAVEVAALCEEAGIKAVTVHPRTAAQLFKGKADWNVIKDVKKAIRIPVIGNGDIKNETDAKRMLADTGCDGIMVGRAVLGNPWILQRIITCLETGNSPPCPAVKDSLGMLLEHAKLIILHYGEKPGALRMRKFALWYTKGLPDSARFRERLSSATTLEGYEKIYETMLGHYADILEERITPC